MKFWTMARVIGGLAAMGATLGTLAAPGVLHTGGAPAHPQAQPTYKVAGEDYQICRQPGYLTSAWTYDSLKKGSRAYSVAAFEALPGYGSSLPPLPAYIGDEPPKTEAAVIFAPTAVGVEVAGYAMPATPILFFFEGGDYGPIDFSAVSGDLFVGGSSQRFSEPVFNDAGGAQGIGDVTSHFGFSGGQDTGSGARGSGKITVTAGGEGAGSYLTFADGTNYRVAATSGTTLTLRPHLRSAESNSLFWYNNDNEANDGENQIGEVSRTTQPGKLRVRIGGWYHKEVSQPIVPGEEIVIGDQSYFVTSATGSQRSGYTLTLKAPIARVVRPGTPVWYADEAGGVTIEYLNIEDDLHTTGGTLTTGYDWTIEHDSIHDGYARGVGHATHNAAGVAIYGGYGSTVEYNCFRRMGVYAINAFGSDTVFAYNQVDETPYNPDLSGNGQSGCGKWWATENDDIVDNAFTDEGRSACVWFDDGNTGQLVKGNYFYDIAARAVQNETGYNSRYVGNLFDDVSGGIYLNDSGGWIIPGSRYNDVVTIEGNIFDNVQEAVNIWGASARSCLSSGEAVGSESAAYCSGGFPQMPDDGQYFTHYHDSIVGALATVAANGACSSSSPCSTVTLSSAPGIDDRIGFANTTPDTCSGSSPCGSYTSDPVEASTRGTNPSVRTFTGLGTIDVKSTAGFPSSGQLLVSTSAGPLPYSTGAVVSYSGETPTSFTGVDLLSGSGTPSGTIEAVQPYRVTAVRCPGGNCSGSVVASISPPITSHLLPGTAVYSTGTCAYYVTVAATPSSPSAPDGTSYYDGCMWEDRNILVKGNTFDVDPASFGSAPMPEGADVAWTCVTGATGNCGQNDMGYQYPGGDAAPYNNVALASAMMSGGSPRATPKSLYVSPNALLGKSQYQVRTDADAPYDNFWTDNTYVGDWTFQAFTQSAECPLQWTGHALAWVNSGGDACSGLSLSQWKKYWREDAGSNGS